MVRLYYIKGTYPPTEEKEQVCKKRLYYFQNLKLSNGSLSFQYWQRPGVIRLTKVYIFNVTNPDNFLNLGEKPKLQEIGPFVYR